MSKFILTQSDHGRSIDCTDLIEGNKNYIQATGEGNEDKMIVLLHKPAVPVDRGEFKPERVEVIFSNPDLGGVVVFCVDFNGDGVEYRLHPGEQLTHVQTIQGYRAEAVLSVRKDKGEVLFASGGAEN